MTAYLVAGGIAFVAAMLGGLATDIGDWYRNLQKPSWQPPDWLFAPVWTLIFALIAWSAGAAWLAATPEVRSVQVVLPFAANLLLNVAWSFLFFRLQRPRLALKELLLLWLSIVVLMAALWPISEFAALLLLPYLLWVSFAGWLNLTIVRLNPAVG
ncbi:MAG: TspO/MBR family protein [Pseudomonadales bacterium]